MSESLLFPSLKKLKFPFQGPGWESRFVVGTALILANYVIPIVPAIFVGGYILRVMRQTLNGQEPALPEWDDWGRLAKDGLSVALINLVYSFPALALLMGGMALYFVGTLSFPFAASTGGKPQEQAISILLITLGSMAVLFLSMLLGMLFSIAGMIAMPVATAHFVAQDSLGAAFRVRRWWRILTADKLSYLIGWVIVIGLTGLLYLASVLASYTLILCFLIPFLMAPIGLYISLVGAALFGQTYRENAALVDGTTTAPNRAGASPAP